jgi:hypothetical protein
MPSIRDAGEAKLAPNRNGPRPDGVSSGGNFHHQPDQPSSCMLSMRFVAAGGLVVEIGARGM